MGNLNKTPPFANWLLRRLLRYSDHQAIIGDFEENYMESRERTGALFAWIWYWWQVLYSVPAFLFNFMTWSFIMLKNHLKVSFRNMIRQKTFSIINVFGLGIGIACTVLILIWVQDQLSYDQFHENAKDIFHVYRRTLETNNSDNSEITPGPAARDLKNEFPEITQACRYGFTGETLIQYKNQIFLETQIRAVDPSFFTIFTFPFVSGNPKDALNSPNSLILTEEAALKYFPNEEPLGKVIKINKKYDYVVTGIIKNVPQNSHIKFKFLVPFISLPQIGGGYQRDINRYSNSAFYTYVLLNTNTDYQEISHKISTTFSKAREKEQYYLVPFSRMYLYEFKAIYLVYLFSAIGFFILLIACINFINLSTARAIKRMKEVGVRKVIGAKRGQLIQQFFAESILYTSLSCLFALLLIQMILPSFNQVLGYSLAINITNSQFLLGLLFIYILTLSTTGIYPAFYFSRSKPASMLSNNVQLGHRKTTLRKFLVVTQFTFSIFFIISTIIIYRQGVFVKTGDLGFDRENVLYIRLKGDICSKKELLKKELLANPNIAHVSLSNMIPMAMGNSTDHWGLPNMDQKISAYYTWVDEGYVKTLGLKMASGRFFSKEFQTDQSQSIVINEAAFQAIGLENTDRQTIHFWGEACTLIGVIKDFHNTPLMFKIKPLILRLNPDQANIMFIKLQPGYEQETIRYIQDVCAKFSNGFPLDHHFLVDFTYGMEKTNKALIQLLFYFTFLAIFISCLGLFGLSSFVSEQRTKEIGIRKVLGSSSIKIFKLLSKEYFILLIFANVIGWPLGYLMASGFLQNFAYKIQIGFDIFLIAGGFATFVAILSISLQTIKSALLNPVDSLRYE